MFDNIAILETAIKYEKRNFDVVDAKGRVIGGSVKTWTEERVVSDAKTNWLSSWVGIKYFYEPHALRDGQYFGAIQNCKCFDTADERDAAVEKYFANATKRAVKAK